LQRNDSISVIKGLQTGAMMRLPITSSERIFVLL
jgi:hypothetical protein